MKTKRFIKLISLAAALCVTVIALASCGAAKLNVTVSDSGVTTDVETAVGTKVSEVLKQANITLGSKDKTDPGADEELKEGDKEIIVKRYAKVTVVFNGKSQTVELIGGTVEQAVEKAGFTLNNGVEADSPKGSFLKDGMTITLSKEITVKLTDGGKSKEYTTKASTVKAFLDEQKIKLGKDDIISPDKDEKLEKGDEIIIKRVTFKEEKKTETVKYSTKKQSDDTLEAGSTKTVQSGVNGKKEITYKVKYIDGKEDSRKKINEKVVTKAVDEIIAVGTKQQVEEATETPEPSPQPAPTQAPATQAPVTQAPAPTQKTVVSKEKVLNCDGSGHGYYHITYSDGSEGYEEF